MQTSRNADMFCCPFLFRIIGLLDNVFLCVYINDFNFIFDMSEPGIISH